MDLKSIVSNTCTEFDLEFLDMTTEGRTVLFKLVYPQTVKYYSLTILANRVQKALGCLAWFSSKIIGNKRYIIMKVFLDVPTNIMDSLSQVFKDYTRGLRSGTPIPSIIKARENSLVLSLSYKKPQEAIDWKKIEKEFYQKTGFYIRFTSDTSGEIRIKKNSQE